MYYKGMEQQALHELILKVLANQPPCPQSVSWLKLRFFLRWGFPIVYSLS